MDAHPERTTQIVLAAEARKQLWEGMRLAAEVIGCTLGPRGKTVLIQQASGRAPVATKDGVTCAKAIRLSDPVKQMGAQLVCEAAAQTNDEAGDGTTTASVLTAAMVKEGLRLVEADRDAVLLCKGIEAAADIVAGELRKAAKPISEPNEIAQVATISANGDSAIGELISRAMQKVGKDGIITVEDAKGMATTMDVVEGMQVDRGYISPYFVNDNERMRAVYEGASVLITDRKLSSFKDIVPLLEQLVKAQKALLIVADDFEGEAMTGLVLNRVKSNLPIVAIKAPGYGQRRAEMLQDMCRLTGATLVSASTGTSIDKVTGSMLGHCKRFVTDARTTTIVGTGSTKQAVEKHVEELRAQTQDVTLGAEDRDHLRARIARLAAGVAVIRVGGATEVEMIEKKYRIEDALNATKAAADEGIVPGGGMALYDAVASARAALADEAKARLVEPDEAAGAEIVFRACLAPLRRIVTNAGRSPDVVIARVNDDRARAKGMHGYNAATDEHCDLVEQGVIDPVKVTRTALKNAASVAVTFLSLNAVVYEDQAPERGDDR